MKSLRPRATKVVAALVVGLALGELGLRAAGWVWAPPADRAVDGSGRDGGRTIVCLGDSNVFGLFLPAAESYPARLEALLNRGEADGPHRVLNLGRSGTATTHLVRELPRVLAEKRPDLALVTTGFNNSWAWIPTGDAAGGPGPWEELRLFKLGRILVQALRPRDGREASEGLTHVKGEALAGDARRESIVEGLRAIDALCAEAGVPLVLVAYASNELLYGATNEALRAAARGLDVPLVDPREEIAAVVGREGWGAVFFPDRHPRALGYEVVARLVHDELVARALVDGTPLADPLAGLEADAGPKVAVALAPAEGGGYRFSLDGGPPGTSFWLAIWGPHRGSGARGRRPDSDFANDPLFRSPHKGRLVATFDAGGRAEIPVDARVFGEDARGRAGLRFWASCFFDGEAASGRAPTPSAPTIVTVP